MSVRCMEDKACARPSYTCWQVLGLEAALPSESVQAKQGLSDQPRMSTLKSIATREAAARRCAGCTLDPGRPPAGPYVRPQQKWPGVLIEIRKRASFGLRLFDFKPTDFGWKTSHLVSNSSKSKMCAARTKSDYFFDFFRL